MKTLLHNQFCKEEINNAQYFLFNNALYMWKMGMKVEVLIYDKKYNFIFLVLNYGNNKLVNWIAERNAYNTMKERRKGNVWYYLSWKWKETWFNENEN